MNEKNKKKQKNNNWPLGLTAGLMFGVAFGTMNDNLGLWVLLGLCVGMTYDRVLAKKTKKEDVDGS